MTSVVAHLIIVNELNEDLISVFHHSPYHYLKGIIDDSKEIVRRELQFCVVSLLHRKLSTQMLWSQLEVNGL